MFNSCLTCFSIASVPRSEAIALCAENASVDAIIPKLSASVRNFRSEEHTSELQSQSNLVCRLLLEKKKKKSNTYTSIPSYHSLQTYLNLYSTSSSPSTANGFTPPMSPITYFVTATTSFLALSHNPV